MESWPEWKAGIFFSHLFSELENLNSKLQINITTGKYYFLKTLKKDEKMSFCWLGIVVLKSDGII